MEFIRGLHNLRAEHRGCVATIGNFDGVHLGHKAVISRLHERAEQYGCPSTVITFEPYPQNFFAKGKGVIPRLTRMREKLEFLRTSGIDRVFCVRFDQSFADLSAKDFIIQILVGQLGVKYLVVGDDFRFGKQRQGDFHLLKSLGAEYGFEVEDTPTLIVENDRVSSTRVRKALSEGSMGLTQRLLGRYYQISGKVAHGDKRGRLIGFPTANIHLHRETLPIQGVFAVTVELLDDKPLAGIANIGNRPTVDGVKNLLEAHLFEFDREIYGTQIKVNFIQKIRDEKKFDGLDALVAQIEIDSLKAKSILQKYL